MIIHLHDHWTEKNVFVQCKTKQVPLAPEKHRAELPCRGSPLLLRDGAAQDVGRAGARAVRGGRHEHRPAAKMKEAIE